MSDLNEPPPCTRCRAATQHAGHITMPPQIIYRCTACGEYIWKPTPIFAAPRSVEQPVVQQQQQTQPADKADEPDSA
jgi:tRNA(Ile2) C34 agmatinyltransferase TiaS